MLLILSVHVNRLILEVDVDILNGLAVFKSAGREFLEKVS